MSFFPWCWFLAQVVYLLYFLINKMSTSYLKKKKKKRKEKKKKYHIQPCDILRGAMILLQDYQRLRQWLGPTEKQRQRRNHEVWD